MERQDQENGRGICASCRHPRPLHSNGTSECKARGCRSGPDGGPCPGFASAPAVSVPLPVFQPPGLAAASA